MRVLVTGASGRVGRYVAAQLKENGDQAITFDRDGGDLLGDLTRPETAVMAVRESAADAIVHMAAWPDPGIVSDARTYGDNVSSTFNLLQAASDYGVQRAIIASSAQVYGFFSGAPQFAPVDESHPLLPDNSYAASKVACEAAGEYFSRVHGMKVLAFRIMGARTPDEMEGDVAKIAADPRCDRALLWTRIDVRDVARACALALVAPEVEAGAYNLSGPEISIDAETTALMRAHWPATRLLSDLQGRLSPLSSVKATKAFGFHAKYPPECGGSIKLER